MKKLRFTTTALVILFWAVPGKTAMSESTLRTQQNYSGTYLLQTAEVTLTLELSQDAFGNLSGTLSSSNGTRFTLEGMVSEGVAAGVCSAEEGGLYFEAYLEGNDLTLSLIQPDAFNMPDYDNAQYLVMSRTAPSAGQPDNQSPVQPQNQSPVQPQNQSPVQPQNQPSTNQAQVRTSPVPATQQRNNAPAPSGTEKVGDDLSGYSFIKPAGWVHQPVDGQFLLGSNTIPGLISVFPHQAANMQQMAGLMQEGLQEEGVYLTLEGTPVQKGANLLTAMCTGYVQGEQAKGYVIGVLGNQGGGIFVLAVSTPQKLGQEIMAAADYIAGHTEFSQPKAGDSDLVRHFSGQWMWTNSYRTEWLTFYPDGSFSDQYEASYSGNMSDGSGNITGNWGVANQQNNMGRWSVQGNREQGVITVIKPDGSRTTYEYSVFIERGQKYYREYMLNGYHYAKQKDF